MANTISSRTTSTVSAARLGGGGKGGAQAAMGGLAAGIAGTLLANSTLALIPTGAVRKATQATFMPWMTPPRH